MNAQQMQELCRELVDACHFALECTNGGNFTMDGPNGKRAVFIGEILKKAITKAESAFNPTPSANGCVETAATVPACVGTGETVNALGVGPVDACPVCGERLVYRMHDGVGSYACGKARFEDCGNAELLAIERAKQLADAEAFIRFIAEVGGKTTEEEGLTANGAWCAEQARSYLHDKAKQEAK